MNIPATELKNTLKKLSPVRAENFQIGAHGISALDSDVLVFYETPLSALGEFTVGGKKLTQVVNRMSGSVSLTLEGHSLTIKSAKAEIVLEAKPAKKQQVPTIPNRTQELNLADFKRLLAVAVPSASPNKSAGFGGVVQIKSEPLGLEDSVPKGWRVVGTNGKVLTMCSVHEIIPHEISTLLNLTACSVVQLMENETLTYGEGPTGPYLKSGNLTMFAARPDQVYPNIDGLLATKPTVSFQFKPEEWLAAFRTVEPVMELEDDGGSMVYKVALHFSEGVVQFSSSGTGATARDESGYEQETPDPLLEPVDMTLVMIADHLSGFLGKASGAATLSFSQIDKPLVLECGGVKVLTFCRKGSKK